jgi:predicted ATPase/DNA-binding CsgD family transcriptional regulator/transcriptional regulator with XRE-family HTH domain
MVGLIAAHRLAGPTGGVLFGCAAMTDEDVTFGHLLQRYRTAAALSQEALAERAGISARGIRDLERGARRSPRLETVRLLAAALDLDPPARAALAAAARLAGPAGTEPASASPDEIIPAGLPVPLTSLVGRKREVATVVGLLRDPAVRLLTLTGPGGVGKTRLALRVAEDARDLFVDGVTFVPLASILDPTLIAPVIARALGVREVPGRPLVERLKASLAGQERLVVLDNFEQVVDAALLVVDLLAACPRLKVLVTSRVALRVSGEHGFSVPSLTLPDPALTPDASDLARVEAIALFVQRARAVQPAFSLTESNASAVAELCVRLEGLPLAIELAAARSKLLPPPAMLGWMGKRLDLLTTGMWDQPARMRTMRDAIGWSYDLLPVAEQALFRCLAIFRGGCTLEAAEAVCASAVGPSLALLDGVSSLLDKSLVHRLGSDEAEPRFGMLETVREFASERLIASGEEDATGSRHTAYFADWADHAESHLAREVEAPWLLKLETDHDNLRGALTWALDQEPETAASCGLRLSGALWLFWYYHGHLTQGRRWLERSLAVPGGRPDASRARALVGLATLEHFQGDEVLAQTHLAEAVPLWRSLGDAWGTAFALTVHGIVAEDGGSYDEAAVRFTEAHDLFASVNDRANVAVTLYHLGVVAFGQGQLETALTRCQDALALGRDLGDPWTTANPLAYLILIHTARHDYGDAASAVTEALVLYRQLGTAERVAEIFRRAAVLAEASGAPRRSIRLFAAAQTIAEPIGVTQGLPERETYERALSAARSALGEPAAGTAWTEGRDLTLDDAVAEARGVGASATFQERPERGDGGRTNDPGLTPREREVLRLLAQRLTDREIAAALFVGPRTVQSHVAGIFNKLGVNSRREAVAAAARLGLS